MTLLSVNIIGLAALLGAGLLVYALGLIAYTAYSLTHPPRRTYASALARGISGDPSEVAALNGAPGYQEFTFTSRGKRLCAWEVLGGNAAGDVVVFTHGWGDSRIGSLSRLEALAATGYLQRNISSMIAWDLPGHGESEGSCSLGLREADDLLTLIESLPQGPPVVLIGWSLGAGVSIAAAAAAARQGGKRTIRAVVAQSPYADALTPARNVLQLAGLPSNITLKAALAIISLIYQRTWNGYDRVVLAAGLACPLIVIHGGVDAISPVSHGRAIAGAVPGGRGVLLEITGAGHHGLWRDEAGLKLAKAVAATLGWK